MSAISKITTAIRNSSLLAGVQKRFPTLNLPTFPVGGVMYTLVKIVGVLQPLVDAEIATVATKAQWQKALQQQKNLELQTKQFITDLKAAVFNLFGNTPDALADFGLTPKKAAKPRTTVTRVVAMAKGANTRTLRHTTGPKKKLEIKGAVPATIEITVPGALTSGTVPGAGTPGPQADGPPPPPPPATSGGTGTGGSHT